MSILELAEQRKQARESSEEAFLRGITPVKKVDEEFDELEIIEDEPAVNPPTSAESGPAGLIELILKDRPRLHKLLRIPALQTAYLPRLLAIALGGFLLYGIAMSLVLTVAHRWPELTSIATWLESPWQSLISFDDIGRSDGSSIAALTPWTKGGAWRLIAAYAFGLVAATGVCLPSLYFYCLLAGLKLRMVEIVVHSVKAKAVSAVALVGILPIYVAMALGAVIFGDSATLTATVLVLGLLLPLVAGLWGTTSIYNGFSALADTMIPPGCATTDKRIDLKDARQCFLRRLVFSWSCCYLAVMPVMVYSVWHAIS